MMKKTISARRVPRKIGQEDEHPYPSSTEGDEVSEPALRRPIVKPRKASSLRTSFGPLSLEDDESEPTGVVTPKRSNLSRIATQRNAAKRSFLNASSLSSREHEDDGDGPTYSAASLQELKESTPTTPLDLSMDTSSPVVEEAPNGAQALDLTSKFGSSLSRYQQPSAIPSTAEIAEKKARRARLAKEQAAEEYISLDPSDPELDEDEDDNVMRDEDGRLVLKPKDKYSNAETRLVRDDEDVLEDFEDFTEADGKILVSRKAEAEAARQRKQEMANQIAKAEAGSDSESNTSEREGNEAFEAAQTRHGTYGSYTSNDPHTDARPRTPPKISPLPTLEGVIERLRGQVSDMQTSRMQKLQEMQALQREKIRLGEEEIRIQRALRETAEKFALLRAEKGISAPPAREGTPVLFDTPAAAGVGLVGDSGASTDVEQPNGGHAGLGFGMVGRGLESMGTSAVGTPASGDGYDNAGMSSDT